MHFKESLLGSLSFYSFIYFLPCYIVHFQVYRPDDDARFLCLVAFSNSHLTILKKKDSVYVLLIFCKDSPKLKFHLYLKSTN